MIQSHSSGCFIFRKILSLMWRKNVHVKKLNLEKMFNLVTLSRTGDEFQEWEKLSSTMKLYVQRKSILLKWHRTPFMSIPASSRYKASRRASATCSVSEPSTRRVLASHQTLLGQLWQKPVQVGFYAFIKMNLICVRYESNIQSYFLCFS